MPRLGSCVDLTLPSRRLGCGGRRGLNVERKEGGVHVPHQIPISKQPQKMGTVRALQINSLGTHSRENSTANQSFLHEMPQSLYLHGIQIAH